MFPRRNAYIFILECSLSTFVYHFGVFHTLAILGDEMTTGFHNPSGTLSNEKRAPGWLCYIGDEILPSYIGIIS